MCIKQTLISAVLVAYTLVNADPADTHIHFPDELETKLSESQSGILNNFANKTQYEQYINLVISRGISNLSLNVNKAYQDTRMNGDNIVFAPLNIAGALALILLGSNGKTFLELSEVLGLATGIDIENNSERVHEELGRIIRKIKVTARLEMSQQISFASAVFIQNDYPIRKLYKETAEDLYQNQVLNVDFGGNPKKAAQLVNAWVSDRTFGKITDILTEIPSPITKVIVASAMYLKARWTQPFFDGQTARRPFFPNGRKTLTDIIQVDMMANAGYFPYYKNNTLGCEILGLPYQGNGTTMYIIVPFNSNTNRLKEFEQNLTATNLERLAQSTVSTNALILLPKMKIETTIDLKSVLTTLGVKSLFDPSEANLGLLSLTTCQDKPENRTEFSKSYSIDNLRKLINHQNPGLFVDKVIHKVYVDITESGTEAAAATAITFFKSLNAVSFRVDVPFILFIRHEDTKSILFWGSVEKPAPYS